MNVTAIGPVYAPWMSPSSATARFFAGSADAEIAVDPTCSEVETSVPVMSAYVRITHQLPLGAHPLGSLVSSPVRFGMTQQLQFPRMALA